MDASAVENTLREIAARAVELGLHLGADQAEAAASQEEGLSVTVRLGEVESVERQRDRGLAVTVYKETRKGATSTSDFSERGVEDAVRKALSIASFTAQDPYAGLADAELMAKGEPPDLELYFPSDLGVDAATELALRAENAARGFDPRIDNSEGATAAAGEGLRIYANSHGFIGGYPTSNYSASCGVIAKGDGSLERDYWYTVARAFGDLDDPEQVGRRAAERAVSRLGARQVKTKVVPVIFPAELARSLFGHLIAAIRGTSQYRKSTFLLDSIGKQIFPDFIEVEEDPFIPRGLASGAFDAEGVATRRRMLVERGVLQGYVLSSYSARRLGMQTTGNAGGAHNLVVKPTAGPLEELVADCEEAFVVGELLGQGVNPVTGDYSRGAAGYWVERGKIAYPVNEVTVAGNLVEIFGSIRAVGSDVDVRGGIRTGSVLVDKLTIAGQ
ncbi:MAG TPA: metalloprotease PmbA [Gammaproteobacteria bacterium]|nr:metalloprotease PmbA [Gammaproteobacteria bacterium]